MSVKKEGLIILKALLKKQMRRWQKIFHTPLEDMQDDQGDSPSLKNSVSRRIRELQAYDAYSDMDMFSQALYELFHITVLPTLLRNYDRYSMANGVEVRMPFMDHRLVSYSFSLPWRAKVDLENGFTKRIERDALKGLVDDRVRLRRQKIGWNAPVDIWLRRPEMICWAQELIRDSEEGLARDMASAALDAFRKRRINSYRDGEEYWRKLLPLAWKAAMINGFK